MKLCANIVNDFQSLTIFARHSILDVWLDSEYVSGISYKRLYETFRIFSCSIWVSISVVGARGGGEKITFAAISFVNNFKKFHMLVFHLCFYFESTFWQVFAEKLFENTHCIIKLHLAYSKFYLKLCYYNVLLEMMLAKYSQNSGEMNEYKGGYARILTIFYVHASERFFHGNY